MESTDFKNWLNNQPSVADDELLSVSNKQPDKTISHSKLMEELDKTYNGKVSLRLPKSLHQDLVVSAKKEGISLNQFILYKLAK